MAPQQRRFTRLSRSAAVIVTATAALVLAACSGSGGSSSTSSLGFTPADQVKNSTITVWVDAAREPAVKAFEAKYPKIKVNEQTYDGNAGGSDSFKTKIALFDQSGQGWPDVVWSTQTNDASWASKGANGAQPFAAPLNKGWFDQSFLDGFTKGAQDPVTIDGTMYGLRNDLAQVVFWYDQKLLDQFGYTAPQTWEDYQSLSDKLASEHPGYILGSVGDSFVGTYVYYMGAQAPIFQATKTTFSSNFDAPKSKKMTDLIDHMLKNGTLVQDSVFSADFVKKYQNKIVGMPGPIWYTGALFQSKDSLNVPAGRLGAGVPLHWAGDKIATGNVGGGVWYASSHTKNLDAVKTFMQFVTSADEYQVDLAPGYPAYAAAATKWIAKQAAAGYFVGDFEKNVTDAAGQTWSGWGYPSFSSETAYAKVVVPGLAAGKTVAALTDAWKTEMDNEAQVQGYKVK
jgi:multiple sugar transport system substrate-binding protein